MLCTGLSTDGLFRDPSAAQNNVSRRAQTAAERLREKKLREDAMALVHDSRLVQCRRCGAKIKLSLKSAFDPCHWQKHRVRCLRRADNIVSGLKLENEKVRPARPFVRSSRTRRISSQTLIFLRMILRRFTLAQPRMRSRLSLRVRRTARQ